ncbi:ankyrin repeat-containing domain protein [Lactarius deliciosus]|nr:ankyrin repeat-containing domain protein [Lactarius deliciosus]
MVSAQVLKTTNDLKDTTTDIKDDTKETKLMVQQIVSDVSSREWERFRGWLTPPDPSTNHINACSTQHDCTAAWVFDDDIFKEWESSQSGSLLWIHGKAGSGKSILCSAIVQHLITLRDAGSASVAYFYFDFRDLDKKNCRNLVSSLLIQLSSRSRPCLDVLSRVYSTYNDGKERPSERTLVKCLKDMLMALSAAQLPTYIILDALDECPNTSGIPTPRGHVLGLVTDLVDLRLPNLHICITSRPESDISTALKPLTSGHFSLHDQPGQQKDISEYVSSVVQSDPQMKRWREDDRKLVIDTLSEKADGMFRWVFCQLELLRHCLAPSLRRQLNELPKSLDETYERVLKEIESTNQGRHARRLLQCLAVAIRPLRVEELAEVLAFDLDATKAEIPTFHVEWRWEDQEQAVLSACSSLISIVGSDLDDNSRVVQFSHFSVKEYLTSDRLATTGGDVSRYYIDLEPAHLILAQACLGVLLNSDNCVIEESEEGSSENKAKTVPLLKYGAEHWASHAQVGNVSSRVKDAMETLFDLDKPYFLEWKRIYDIYPGTLCDYYLSPTNPLYYAALCGFYDLVQCLIAKYPDQVNRDGSHYNSPLTAALFNNHVRVAYFLLEHGTHVHVRGNPPLCHAIQFSDDARDPHIARLLLGFGMDVNARDKYQATPLHFACSHGNFETALVLLDHGAEVNARNDNGQTPLHSISPSSFSSADDNSRLAQLLLEHGADVNARDKDQETPLHLACSMLMIETVQETPLHAACSLGNFEIALVLLDHGADIWAQNADGQIPLHSVRRSPFHSEHGYLARLLLECGVDVNAQDKNQETPLHLASYRSLPMIVEVLLDHGADPDARNADGQTPLHKASQCDAARVAQLLMDRSADANTRDKEQATPLHLSSYHGSIEVAEALLDHNAWANVEDIRGRTPLHQVLLGNHNYQSYKVVHGTPSLKSDQARAVRLARRLLERSVDVNAQDKDHETPLHLASRLRLHEMARILLKHGADVNMKNSEGKSPLELAHGRRGKAIKRLLLEYSAMQT